MDDDSTVVKNSDQNSSLSAFQIAVGDSSRKANRMLKKRKDGLVWRFWNTRRIVRRSFWDIGSGLAGLLWFVGEME